MKRFVIGFLTFFKINLVAGLLLLLGTSCTKDEQIGCPECGTLSPETPSFRQDTLSAPDTTTIVIDDTLIL